MKTLFLLPSALMIMLFTGCEPKKAAAERETEESSHFPTEMKSVLDAHGGYGSWSKMQSLTFEMKSGELHQTSLWDRKALITSDVKTIGYDGKDVWVTPDTIPVGNARFYYSVYFYFYAMPFVLGDPGIVYESIGSKELLGKSYNGIKISYINGVGDAPKDNYILWYDPATSQMEWLMYTVTFGSDTVSDDYRLIRYSEWAETSGLKLPTKLDWYVYENDEVGEVRNTQVFSNVSLSEKPFDNQLFAKPEKAQISPLD